MATLDAMKREADARQRAEACRLGVAESEAGTLDTKETGMENDWRDEYPVGTKMLADLFGSGMRQCTVVDRWREMLRVKLEEGTLNDGMYYVSRNMPARPLSPALPKVGEVWRFGGRAGSDWRVAGPLATLDGFDIVSVADGSRGYMLTKSTRWTKISDAPAAASPFVVSAKPSVMPALVPPLPENPVRGILRDLCDGKPLTREPESDRMRRFFFPPEQLPSMAPPIGAPVEARYSVGDWVRPKENADPLARMQVMSRTTSLPHTVYACSRADSAESYAAFSERDLVPAERPR